MYIVSICHHFIFYLNIYFIYKWKYINSTIDFIFPLIVGWGLINSCINRKYSGRIRPPGAGWRNMDFPFFLKIQSLIPKVFLCSHRFLKITSHISPCFPLMFPINPIFPCISLFFLVWVDVECR